MLENSCEMWMEEAEKEGKGHQKMNLQNGHREEEQVKSLKGVERKRSKGSTACVSKSRQKEPATGLQKGNGKRFDDGGKDNGFNGVQWVSYRRWEMFLSNH